MRTVIKFQLLSKDDIYKIHTASLDLLAKTGVRVEHEDTRTMLKDIGANAGSGDVVKFPSDLVEEYVKMAPSSVVLRGRDPKKDIRLDDGEVHFSSGSGSLIGEGKVEREPTNKDCADWAKLGDYIKNVEMVLEIHSRDVPKELSDIYNFRAIVRNLTKPFMGSALSRDGLTDLVRMGMAVTGGEEEFRKRPIWTTAYSAISPLRWQRIALDVFKETAEYDIPVTLGGESIAGATSPVMTAATLVQTNAELLSGIVINQCYKKGRPCISNVGYSYFLDMKTGQALHGAVVTGIYGACCAEMSRFYNIPSVAWMGTDSKLADSQAGYEKALTGVLPALAGASLILGMGQKEFSSVISFEHVIIDDEIVTQFKRALAGVEVNDETLGLDLIKQVGIGGSFLTHKARQTFKYVEKENPSLIVGDRNNREKWLKLGAGNIIDKAAEIVTTILREHQPEPLPKHVNEQLDKIIEEAKKRCL